MFATMDPFGLVILGSDVFENDLEADRGSFRASHNDLLHYFTDRTGGLDLQTVNCSNLFGSQLSASDQIDEIEKWLGSRPHLTDIFVFVVTHGIRYARDPTQPLTHGELYFRLRRSKVGSDGEVTHDSCLRFGALTQILTGHRQRLHVILDCCYSGLAHNDLQLGRTMPPDETDEITAIASPPSHSLALLTANSTPDVGEVYAVKDRDAGATAFTAVLLDILVNGVRDGHPYGLSFDALAREVNIRMALHLDKATMSAESRAALRRTQLAKASSDDYGFDDGPAPQVPLSMVPVFPNRVPANAYRNQIARRIRRSISAVKEIQHRHEEALHRFKLSLAESEATGKERARLISELKDQLEKTASANGELTEKLNRSEDANDKLEDKLKLSKKANLVKLALLSIVLALTLLVAILPENRLTSALSWLPGLANEKAVE